MTTLRKLTPVLVVERVEPVLAFWVNRLGFAAIATVPHEDAIGFVLLEKDGVQLMYQSRASSAADIPGAVPEGRGLSVTLYVDVADLDGVSAALRDIEPAVARRKTFYGTEEIGWREPGGHLVLFARHVDD